MSMLRRWLLAGLLVTLPLVVTLWVLDLIVTFLDSSLKLIPNEWLPEVALGFKIPGLGVVLTLCIVLLIGAFASNYLGAKLFRWWDDFLGRIPIVRSIYSAVKQISDTVFASKGDSFREAVLVQFPREGSWTIAFLTGKPTGELADHMNPQEWISVYVPTTPNPTSGYFILLRKDETVALKMSVDEALKVIVSMGVIPAPESKSKHVGTMQKPKIEAIKEKSAENHH
ncbi:MAG: DUF502 domain-containing protein [Saezia sp.]